MTDVPKNIHYFNLAVLTLLKTLYESFPSPKNLDPFILNDICFDAVPKEDSEEDAWKLGNMGEDVITFLEEEGFLRYEPDPNHREGYYGRTRLSLKGLTILGWVPNSLESQGKKSLIERAKDALSKTSTSAGSETVKQVVSEVFKMALDG
ncbi:MAG: hypothetical protein MRJ67_16285 [Nitrospirales bacterium]|nr:hypothetical protein [Nitrospirales bacterium]